jgi:rare lipoprotein A
MASWYGPGFDGRPTASGAIYDMEGWTVASPDLPLGSLLVVANGAARVLLLVNDRGPYVDGRVLDLSHAAAAALGMSLGPVTADVVAPG